MSRISTIIIGLLATVIVFAACKKDDDSVPCDNTQFAYTYQDEKHTGTNVSTDNFNLDIYIKNGGLFGSSLELYDTYGDSLVKVVVKMDGILQAHVGYDLENSQVSFYNGRKFLNVASMDLRVEQLSHRNGIVADTIAYFVTESTGTLNMKLGDDSIGYENFSLEYCFKLD